MLLRAYGAGIFPMAPARDSVRIDWYRPQQRGVLPLAQFHAARRLMRVVLRGTFSVTADTVFAEVITHCALPAPGREESWISPRLAALYGELHAEGFAHSIEVWRDGALVGGLYGVALGGAFFGESMFSHVSDASKVALVHLVAGLKMGGFTLLDTQYRTAHLAQFGCREIPAQDYSALLAKAVARRAIWPARFTRDALAPMLAKDVAAAI